jgi:hypothetical protein
MCTSNTTSALYVLCFLATAAFAFPRNMQQSIPFAKNPRFFGSAVGTKMPFNVPSRVPSLENTTKKNCHPTPTPVTVPWHDAAGHSVATGLSSNNSKSKIVPKIRHGVQRSPLKKGQTILHWFLYFEHDKTTRPRVSDSMILCNNLRCNLCQNQSMAPIKTTLYKMFQLSRQNFVNVQEKISIGTGQFSVFDGPTRIPVVHYRTMGHNDCRMYVYYNNFKSDSCKTSIMFMGEISNTTIRQELSAAVVKIEDSKEKNHSAWVKLIGLLADNPQLHVTITGTTENGIDAVEIQETMETIGGPTFFTRLEIDRIVRSKFCKNLSMNAILKTFFNVARSYNLDLGTKEKRSIVNGHRATCYDDHMPVTSCGVKHRYEFRTYFYDNNIKHCLNLDSGTKEKSSVGKGHRSRELLEPGFGIEDVVQWASAYAKKKGYEHI